jgi:hypothetical protein
MGKWINDYGTKKKLIKEWTNKNNEDSYLKHDEYIFSTCPMLC